MRIRRGSWLFSLSVLCSSFAEACQVGQTIPHTMFGANVISCEAGWAIGMIPDEQRGRKSELARLLSSHGFQAVRLPGGTCANRFFWDSEAMTRKAARIVGGAYWSGHPNNHMYNYFVPFDDAAAFCRDAGITLIWQLNTATIHDDKAVYLVSRSPVGKDLLPADRFYDRDRLSEAAESVRRFARHIRETRLPVPLFEIGNEEYGHPVLDPLRYSEIVRAYAQALRSEFPDCTLLVTLGDNQMVSKEECRKWAETLLRDLAEKGFRNKIDYFTMHYSWRSVCEFASRLLDRYGFTRSKIAVTEFTCGWPDYWDKTPRYRHGVQAAEFVMDLMAVPRVEIVMIHDLMSQNFGVFHYNQRSFEPPDDRSYDGRIGYVATPTATAYQMMRPLAGAKLLSASGKAVEAERDALKERVAELEKEIDAMMESFRKQLSDLADSQALRADIARLETELAAARDRIRELEALVEQPDLDLVYISTPPFLHYPQAMAALRAGKHVICEKPLARDAETCRRILEAAARESCRFDRLQACRTFFARWAYDHPRSPRLQTVLAEVRTSL